MHVRSTHFSLFTFHFSRFTFPDLPQLHQLRSADELRTNGLIVLVRLPGLGIGPGEAAAHCRVVRPAMDGAPVLDQEDATPLPDPGAPLTPPGLIYQMR